MPFVEYSGKVLPASGEKDFEKGPQGYELSSVKDMAERLGNDWWHLPATAIGAAGLGAAGKAVYDWFSSKSQPPATRIEPTLLEPAAPATPIGPRAPSPGEQVLGTKITDPAERRLADMYAAQQQARGIAPAALGAVPPPAPVPTAPAPAAMPPAAIAPTAPAAVAPSATSVAPAATPIAPAPAAPIPTTFAGATVAESPVTQTTKPQAIPATKAPKQPKATPVAPPLLTGAPEATPQGYYKGIVPPEVLERYKGMTGSGNNFLYNILGPQKFEQFLAQFNEGKGISDYKEALSKWNKHGPEFLQSFGPSMTKEIRKEKGIPPSSLGNFGKVGESGAITPGAALNLLGNALGAVGLVQAYKRGEQTGDWSDFGLGLIGQTLGNVAPKAATPFALMAPGGLNVGEQEELARRRRAAPTID